MHVHFMITSYYLYHTFVNKLKKGKYMYFSLCQTVIICIVITICNYDWVKWQC